MIFKEETIEKIKKEYGIITEQAVGSINNLTISVESEIDRPSSLNELYFKVYNTNHEVARIKFIVPEYVIHNRSRNGFKSFKLNKKEKTLLMNFLNSKNKEQIHMWQHLINLYNIKQTTDKYNNIISFEDYINGNKINNFVPLDTPMPDYMKL